MRFIYRFRAWLLRLLIVPDLITCSGCGKALIGDQGVIACGEGVKWTCGPCCENKASAPIL